MGLLHLKIDNSKRHADHSKRKWKDPGAKLYDQCLNAFYCKGDVPCDTKQLNQAMKDGSYKQWPDFLKEVYLVAPVNDINNSPYGVTPFSRSGCKYPHHVIKNGELVLSVSGIKRAWDMTFYQKSMTPEVKRHLNRHMKELGIEPFFHHGQLYWNEAAESWKQIDSNFRSIDTYLNEQLGINLSEDIFTFNESYDPPLEYDQLPDHLKDDPIHAWRAKSGIELIHKEPTIGELNRIWNNWQQMSDDQKRISNEKSYELFGKNNADHYTELLQEYSNYENQTQVADGVNSEDYIRPLNRNDVTGQHFISWFFKMKEFEDDKPEDFDFNILVNDQLIQNYCYGYFVDMKLEGIIRTRYNIEQNSYAISMLFVNTDKWRSGIGNNLMNYVVSKFGDHVMTLRVFASNAKAISLYEKYGFQKFKTDIYPDGPDSDPKFVGQEMYLMKRDAVQKFEDNCDNMTDFKSGILTVGDLAKYKISEKELEAVKSRFLNEESIDQNDTTKFSKDLPNIMYFASPYKIEELKERVFLSPYIGISSLFIIDRHTAFREYVQKILGSKNIHTNCNLGYVEWNLPNDQLLKPLDTVHVTHNIQEIPGIVSGTSTGYIYTVDISNIDKGQFSLFTTKNPDREIIYTGNDPLNIIHIQQHTTKWTIQFSEENVKIHGFGSVSVKESYNSIEDIKEKYYNERGDNMDDYDDLSWIEAYLTEESEDSNVPPTIPEEVKEESMPKKTDKAESSKNGVRRKNLYIEFIKWCKEYNPKNTFGSIFDKDAFNVTYPFIPDEMRYFYRLANPMLCVLGGNLTFFAAAELRKINAKNSHLNEMMIFAATNEDVRVFNVKDKKVYRGTEENGTLKLNETLGDTFDTYLQKMINKGDILNAPIEESTEMDVEN